MEASASTEKSAPKKANILRRMYDWTISWADTPYGLWALAALSFMESSFFPIPPDVLLIPLVFGAPKKWWKIALACTVASVCGAVLGWYIGHAAWDALKGFFFDYIPGFTPERFDSVKEIYAQWGIIAVLGSALTPIPYKIFTIASGALDYSLISLVLASFAGRGARFFLVALIIYFVGPKAKEWIDKYFNLLAAAFFVLLVGGFLLVKLCI
ncbi:MAG: DedA family protein [Opitutales bacterium]|nr:DedA family protein [Opitutales bacterium]